ncbi:MAG: SH3 domain-containing protein [Lachnospiraceae bacterium]|nr:SH3 domain-containing protein [Lachnospiraceae bacterium]
MNIDERYPDGMPGRRVRKKRNKKQRRKRVIAALLPPLIAVLLIAVIVVVAIKTGLFESFEYSDTPADLFGYYGIEGESEAVIIKDHEITPERIRVRDNELYIPYKTVKSDYTDRFYYEKTEDAILYTRENDTVRTVIGESSYTDTNGANTVPYTVCFKEAGADGEEIYMALDYLKLFFNMEIRLFGGNGEPYRAEIKNEWGQKNTAPVLKEHALRTGPDKSESVLTKLTQGQIVTVIGQEGEWTRVETDDLLIGYAETKHLGNTVSAQETPVTDVPEEVHTSLTGTEPIVLMWHAIAGDSGNDTIGTVLTDVKNVDIIAPTWFSLSDDSGTIRSFASADYVSYVHSKGMKVWGVVDDFNSNGDPSEILIYPEKRASVISQLISLAGQYGLDGINVDFERISNDLGEAFIQFIRELAIECHKNNLSVSVDNYVPKAYNLHYHRGEQGVFCDYVIIMGYDENYAGSEKAGSVASIGFVREGIEETLKEVPPSKVINALPFYTRVWEETPKTDEEIAATPTGEEVIPYHNSLLATPSMKHEEELLANYHAEKTWDETTMQNYSTWTIGDKTYEVWLEDTVSLSAKLGLMSGYGIAGAAGWEITLATPDVWDLIGQFY